MFYNLLVITLHTFNKKINFEQKHDYQNTPIQNISQSIKVSIIGIIIGRT